MRLIPIETVTYTCVDGPDRIAIRLASMVKPGDYQFRVPEGSLYGEVSGHTFKALMGPTAAYDPKGECFFLPVMIGRLDPVGEGTVIRIRFRPAWPNLAVALLLVGFIAFAAWIAVFGIRATGTDFLPEPPRWPRRVAGSGVAAFAALFYLSMVRGFWAGVEKLKGSLPGRVGCR